MEWPPKLPKNFPMTVRDDGYCKSINGRTKWVCGRVSPRDAVKRLHERLVEWSLKESAAAEGRLALDPGELTVKDLANEYMKWLRQRLVTGRPKKLKERTYNDFKMAIQLLVDRVGRDKLAEEIGPPEFSEFARSVPGQSPYTYNRYLAAIIAFGKWASRANRINRPWNVGPDFRKKSKDELDDSRSNLRKEFSVEEIRRMIAGGFGIQVATERPTVIGRPNWRMLSWIFLGINCAFKNRDIAELPTEKLSIGDRPEIHFKRGKTMVHRRAPLWSITAHCLSQYQAPPAARPEYEALFFRTRFGNPYVREILAYADEEKKVLASAKPDNAIGKEFAKFIRAIDARAAEGFVQTEALSSEKLRGIAGMRTTFRTLADAMPNKDNDAIDVVMGHKRKHISAAYVERFPIEKLHLVVDYVFDQLFTGWSSPLKR